MLQVKKECCNQCLFTENRIVRPGRMKEILQDCRRTDSHFQCHKATIEGKDVCCRGFYDKQSSNLIRVAQRLNCVEFVD
jgi:hypothetical protein